MKKRTKIIPFIYLLFAMLLFPTTTFASNSIKLNEKNIKNGTYIIGTHAFTTDGNVVTAKHVMLAARTIPGENLGLDDMKIMYKDYSGYWIDGLTADSLTEIPEEFELEFIDTAAVPIGTIKWGDGTNANLKYEELENELIFTEGEVVWYPENKELGRVEGYRVAAKINAPEGFDTSATTVKIGENNYEWKDIKDGDNFFYWYPLVKEAGEEFTATVTWREGIEQVFKVKISESITLEEVVPKLKKFEAELVEESLILTVQGEDKSGLYSLEIDHTLEKDLHEFSVYGSEENPYGTEEQKEIFESFGVNVTYNLKTQTWVIDFGKDITSQMNELGNGEITFYIVLKNKLDNKLGDMSNLTEEMTLKFEFPNSKEE